MLNYIGAMVRKSTRVVLVIENDFDEVEGDPDADEPCVRKKIVCKKNELNRSKILTKEK